MKTRLLTVLGVLTGIFLLSSSIAWAADAPVEKTGQTTSYRTGDDGDHEAGVAWPSPRFVDNSDGTVTDNLTGLMWTKNANLDNGTMNWNAAIDYANDLSLGNAGCSASYTDWRLPNVKEMLSLIDYGTVTGKGDFLEALPVGHPFIFSDDLNDVFWTSTTYTMLTNYAWYVDLYDGNVTDVTKTTLFYVWPVRGGN